MWGQELGPTCLGDHGDEDLAKTNDVQALHGIVQLSLLPAGASLRQAHAELPVLVRLAACVAVDGQDPLLV